MIKKLFLIVFYIFFPTIVFATTLNGGVSVDTVWDVNSAREELFAKMPQNINVTTYPPFDPYFGEVQKNIQNNNLVSSNKKMRFTYFRDKNGNFVAYSITYYANKDIGYYYDLHGKTISIDFKFIDKNYARAYKYSYPNNTLVSTTLFVIGENEEAFMYDKNGKFFAHWIGPNCYDENGRFVRTREVKEF